MRGSAGHSPELRGTLFPFRREVIIDPAMQKSTVERWNICYCLFGVELLDSAFLSQ